MKQFAFILFSVSAFFFFSCKKDNFDNNVIPPVTIDSNYLSKVFIIDSTAAAEDTLETLSYYYDNTGRVINVTDSFIHAGGVRIPFVSTTYYYNGTDTIPYKLYRISDNGGVYDTATKFFYYDASGRRIKDSSYRSGVNSSNNYIRTEISTYQYATGKIYGYSRDTGIYPVSSAPASINRDTATLDANNYIVSNIKHRGASTVINSQITNTGSRNMYARQTIRNCFDVFPHTYATYNNFGTSNNPSHIVETWPGSGDVYETNTSYISNTNGYISRAIVEDLSIPGQFYLTVLIYTSL